MYGGYYSLTEHFRMSYLHLMLLCANVCSGSELMGHPDLNIDVSQMTPLLDSQQISSLHNQCVPYRLFVCSCCVCILIGRILIMGDFTF